MSGPPRPAAVRASASATIDDACVVALDGEGTIVGRARLSRLYGQRGEVHLDLVPTDEIANALVAAIEADACARGLAQLELDQRDLTAGVVSAVRRTRHAHDEERGAARLLIWRVINPSPKP